MMIDLCKYNIYRVYDAYDGVDLLGLIALNSKQSIEDFQDAINKAKEKHQEEISENGDDWSYIEQELDNFDYQWVDFERDYIEY